MHRHLLSSLCAVALTLPCFATPLDAGEPRGPLAGFARERTWSDGSGRFKIAAELTFADRTEVRLRKSDGLEVTVPLAKLSETDQRFIDGFLAAESALGGAKEDDNPFAGGTPTSATSSRPAAAPSGSAARGSAARDAAAARIAAARSAAGRGSAGRDAATPSSSGGSAALEERQAIVKGFRPLTITPNRAFWSTQPPVAFPAVSLEDLVVQTPLRKPFFASLRVMAAGKLGTVVLNSYQEGRGSRDSFSNFVVVRAGSGDTSAVLELDEPWKLMALSADGSRMAAVRVVGFDKGNDVGIFRIANGQIIPEFQFTAGGGSWDELHWVAFLPGGRLATISQKHDLTFWDLENTIGPKALLRGKSGGSETAEISAAGDLIALRCGTSIAVIETGAGKLVGCIERDEAANGVAFSPDGKMLAAFHPFNVTLYSTTDGSEIRNIAVPESNAQTALRWVGEQLLVGPVLYDVERGVPMWTYESGSGAQATLGSYLITGFGGDNESTVNVFRLPHDEALRAASNVDASQIYAIVPGDSVSVRYDFGPAPANVQQEVRAAVESKLESIGWKVTDNAPHTLEIKLEQGEQKEIEYVTQRGFGPGPFFAPPGFGGRPSGPSEKVHFRAWTHTLKIQSGGEEIFTAQHVRSAPQQLQTKDGESTQAAVNRVCQPSPDYFKNLALPPHVMKKEFRDGLGKSKIERNGLM